MRALNKRFSNGLPYSIISYDNAVRNILSIAAELNNEPPKRVYTPNVHHYYLYSNNKTFKKAYEAISLSLLDGMPLVWAAKTLYKDKVERISGADVFIELFMSAIKMNYRVFLLGGMPGVSQKAVQRMGAADKIGTHVFIEAPPLGFEKDLSINQEIINKINEINPNLVFVALGSPKGELWIYQNAIHVKAGVLIGVGASIDFAAGVASRAPWWVQQCSLEWLFRLVMEPRRLWKRYLISNGFFIAKKAGLIFRKIYNLKPFAKKDKPK
jgi:N-acetylglucosaminyldiphosphoundecaprenol N-acetyl-beta-D-mannosaminyltransferase